MDCVHHEAVIARVDRNEKDVNNLWSAMHEVRDDIKRLIGKIGLIVGIITTVNSIVMLAVSYMIQH